MDNPTGSAEIRGLHENRDRRISVRFSVRHEQAKRDDTEHFPLVIWYVFTVPDAKTVEDAQFGKKSTEHLSGVATFYDMVSLHFFATFEWVGRDMFALCCFIVSCSTVRSGALLHRIVIGRIGIMSVCQRICRA